eukprot:991957-Pelagomonas_calceolata.AAC.3
MYLSNCRGTQGFFEESALQRDAIVMEPERIQFRCSDAYKRNDIQYIVGHDPPKNNTSLRSLFWAASLGSHKGDMICREQLRCNQCTGPNRNRGTAEVQPVHCDIPLWFKFMVPYHNPNAQRLHVNTKETTRQFLATGFVSMVSQAMCKNEEMMPQRHLSKLSIQSS